MRSNDLIIGFGAKKTAALAATSLCKRMEKISLYSNAPEIVACHYPNIHSISNVLFVSVHPRLISVMKFRVRTLFLDQAQFDRSERRKIDSN